MKPKSIQSLDIRITPLLDSTNIKPQSLEKYLIPNILTWSWEPPEIVLTYTLEKNLKQGQTY